MKKISACMLLALALTWFRPVAPVYAEEASAASEGKADSTKNADASKGGDSESKDGGDKDKKKAADVIGGRFAGDPIYVRLSPIVLPILGNTGPEQLVTIQITVEVKDFDTAEDMHTRMPKIMDALIQSLYGGLSSGDLRDGRLADASKIKGKAMSALQKAQGLDSIKDVLIVNLSQRLL